MNTLRLRQSTFRLIKNLHLASVVLPAGDLHHSYLHSANSVAVLLLPSTHMDISIGWRIRSSKYADPRDLSTGTAGGV